MGLHTLSQVFHPDTCLLGETISSAKVVIFGALIFIGEKVKDEIIYMPDFVVINTGINKSYI